MIPTKFYRQALRTVALAMVAAGAVHVLLGVAAERLLDPRLPASIDNLPTLDSQNRFYGCIFSVAGAVLWQAAGDIERFRPIVTTMLVGFMLAGLARLMSVIKVGWPAPIVLVLLVIELIMPPGMLLWRSRLGKAQ